MIKTYYECDACKCSSFSNEYLTTVEIKIQKFVGWRAEVKPTVVALCAECLLDRCGLEFPNKGEPLHPMQAKVEEPGTTERLVEALADFIQENLGS